MIVIYSMKNFEEKFCINQNLMFMYDMECKFTSNKDSKRRKISHLKVFGSQVTIKRPCDRRNKLDNNHSTSSIFLGCTATNRNIQFEDNITGKVKDVRHATFDKAY